MPEDYLQEGWEEYRPLEIGITTVRKRIGERETPLGPRAVWLYAHIADCGDYRLICTRRSQEMAVTPPPFPY